jgi:hypothetical protein
LKTVERDDGAGLCAVCEIEEPLFKLAAEDGFDAEAAQVFGVHWRVEAVAAEAGGGVQQLDVADDFDCQAGGGVHGQPEGDQLRFPNGWRWERAQGQIHTCDLMSGSLQPGGGRGEAEGLMAKVVGGDENYVHLP